VATFPHLFLSYPDPGAGYTFGNTEAEDVVTAMVSEPDDTRKGAIDTLVGALKSAGVWTKLDALWVFAAHTSQAGLLNWKDPAGTAAALVNSPTFTANQGFAGNGSTSYVNTQFVPSTTAVQLTQNSASMSMWSRSSGQSATSAGCLDGSNRGLTLGVRNTSNQMGARSNNNTGSSFSPVTNGIGLFSIIRSGVSTVNAYQNGAAVGSTSTAASVGVPTVAFYVGGYNNNGALALPHNRQYAMTALGGSRNGTEETAFYNAVAAYMTTVGA
jgi:hypothetical protein